MMYISYSHKAGDVYNYELGSSCLVYNIYGLSLKLQCRYVCDQIIHILVPHCPSCTQKNASELEALCVLWHIACTHMFAVWNVATRTRREPFLL